MDFLKIAAESASQQPSEMPLTVKPITGGNKFRQSGGGELSAAINKFNEYVKNSEYFTVDDKKTINDCVVNLTANPEVLDAPVAVQVPPNADANAAAAAAALPTNLSSILNPSKIKELLLSLPGKLQNYINAKLDAKGIDVDKRECMKTIIRISIGALSKIIKSKIPNNVFQIPTFAKTLLSRLSQSSSQP